MARGWESKSVESQMEEAESRRQMAASPQLTRDQIARRREREGFQLSKTRILNDLAKTTNPHYRKSLEAALEYLEQKLADLSD